MLELEDLEFLEDLVCSCISHNKEILKSNDFEDEREENKKETKYAKKVLRKLHKEIDIKQKQ